MRASESGNRRLYRIADHDDELTLTLCSGVKALNEYPELGVPDLMKIRCPGVQIFQPHFKPDFNIDLLKR